MSSPRSNPSPPRTAVGWSIAKGWIPRELPKFGRSSILASTARARMRRLGGSATRVPRRLNPPMPMPKTTRQPDVDHEWRPLLGRMLAGEWRCGYLPEPVNLLSASPCFPRVEKAVYVACDRSGEVAYVGKVARSGGRALASRLREHVRNREK